MPIVHEFKGGSGGTNLRQTPEEMFEKRIVLFFQTALTDPYSANFTCND